MGCFLAVFAVVQMLTGNGRLLWVFPMWPGSHPMGTYVNKNHFAGYMEMAVPVGLGFFLYTASKMKGISGHAGVPFAKRVASFLDNKRLTTLSFGLVSVVIMTGALFLTLSRSAIAGFLVSMVFFAGMARSRRSLRRKWNYIVLIGILIAVAIIAAGWSMIEARFENVAGGGTFKRDVWNDATAVIKDFPALGAGFGTFSRVYPAYQTKYPQWFFDHAENDYLELLIDTGFAGCAAVAGGLAVFLYSLIKRWRKRHNTYVVCAAIGGIASIMAMLIHSMADFNMRIPANALLLTVIAAATCATVFNIQTQRQEKDESLGHR
jgi:O-antigen ligase